ncbi:FAD-dependent oxidoreductase [uncultured Thiodictyon sp.]|uniref:FAD-dependent oxidoreductase n=1 Tax=uncultured Thiodictyon sp. TaxID=1846217 RepID=UPI0025D21998|nr:FAD-dependent oxidoreductase [uncultured Thiodictyon sp.]
MYRQVAVAIIGAGPAGLAAAAEVCKTTRDFVLIDNGGFGSTCARIGCQPSAVAAHLAAGLARRRVLGVGGLPRSELLGNAHRSPAHATALPPDREGLPADALIMGEARFIGPNTLRAGGQTIQARSIVIATGAGSEVPPYWRDILGDRLLTVETAFEQERLPASVAVIGLGPAGLVVAQVLHRLGVQVIGIESSQTIARLQDPLVKALAVDLLGREFPLWLGAPALVEPRGHQVLVRAGPHEALVDRVLVAVGRHPNLERLSLSQAGCALDARGVPLHHAQHLRLGRLSIYIAGDAAGGVGGLARTAEQGRVAGYNACHRIPIALATGVPTTLVFSEPNIAWVGPSWSALDQSFLMTAQMGVDALDGDPSPSRGRHPGLLRVYADRRDGRVLGGAMIGPGCERLAQALAWCVQRRLTAQEMVEMPLDQSAVTVVMQNIFNELVSRVGHKQAKPWPWGRLTWAGVQCGGGARHHPGPVLGARG